MTPSPILLPVAALAFWTMFMLGWMARVRMRAAKAHNINLTDRRGGRGSDLERVLKPEDCWPAHNYTHLHEQPTVFYAVALVLALAGAGSGAALWLAWVYVGLRVLHSIEQATRNLVKVRATLFMLSSFALAAMTVIALLRLTLG